jgi:phage tail sheath protein FI
MMTRRTFFRNIVFGGASLIAAPAILANIGPTYPAPTKRSALERVDVSLLLEKIKKDMEATCNHFIFEPNDELTRNRIKTTLKDTMDEYRSRRAIMDFQVVCDETNNSPETIDKNELNVSLYIQPKYTPEYIMLDLYMTSDNNTIA